MKPMHAKITRVKRCPCCVSKYARTTQNDGKSSTRQFEKKEILSFLKNING